MNIIILHCHYRRGGVTQVVENHVAALTAALPEANLFLVSGPRVDGLSDSTTSRAQVVCIDGLDYDTLHDDQTSDNANQRGHRLADQIHHALASRDVDPLDTDCQTILHWHNHSLGKNVAIPVAIDQLTERYQYSQLLQIHDFAEDFRPTNLSKLAAASESDAADPLAAFNRFCYPSRQGIHYATLTSGDAALLQKLGLPENQIHCLPNNVTLGDQATQSRSAAKEKVGQAIGVSGDFQWFLYPIRGIRRKNLGETLLLSQLSSDQAYFAITLPPTTKIEADSYERWKAIAKVHAPRTVFDAGTFPAISFHDNIAASDCILSTSVAEGFGMAYLEPWLADRGVVARDLPGVTQDFRRSGLALDRFYQSVDIPGSGKWITQCQARTTAARQQAWRQVPPPILQGSGSRRHGANTEGANTEGAKAEGAKAASTIDFATLTTGDQIDVIMRIDRDPLFKRRVQDANQSLLDWLQPDFEASALRHNQQIVRQYYGQQGCSDRLLQAYRELALSPPGKRSQRIDINWGVSLANVISQHRTYFPCRTESTIVDCDDASNCDMPSTWNRAVIENRSELLPIETEQPAKLTSLTDIRAVIFDIYGTLIVSGSGDVGSANEQDRGQAISQAITATGMSLGTGSMPTIDALQQQIRQSNQDRQSDQVPKPDVEIVDCWRQTLDQCGITQYSARQVNQLAAYYESLANPTWPMPGAATLLKSLGQTGIKLGIVSNAQGFTLDLIEEIAGDFGCDSVFDLNLCVFSNRYRQAKPGPRLFDVLCDELSRQQIASHQAIYVGNDRLNDVWAANQAGLRTAWFVGDRRSMRDRADDARMQGLQQDLVITDLMQLQQCLNE